MGTDPSDAANDIAIALDALKAGRGSRATINGGWPNDFLQLEASSFPPKGALAELRGFAQTKEQPQVKGDLQPPRALRRALADARLQASEIGYACAVVLWAADQSRALDALERGLGRFAPTVVRQTAQDPFRWAVAAVGRRDGPNASVALVITPGVGSIALAFGRP